MNLTELFDVPKRTLHDEKWMPDEADKPRIVKILLENLEATIEYCGSGDWEEASAREIYEKVRDNTLAACMDDVQNFFADMYHAVHGEIEKYYDNDPEIIELIKLTVCPEYEQRPLKLIK